MSATARPLDTITDQPVEAREIDVTPMIPVPRQVATFRSWYWLGLPLLAVVAYITVLRIGFLGDDFVLSAQMDFTPVSSLAFPQPGNFLYRPIGLLFVWKLGMALWGFNPLPFHIQGLLLHAITALVLGIWLAEATSNRVVGWLAGALFAVFPLHLEAVGWIAAQWDVLATLFALLSLWLFTRWWRQYGQDSNSSSKAWLYYSLSVLCFALALFTKDSLLSFLPLLPLSAWLARPPARRAQWLRLLLYCTPFLTAQLLNLGMRYATWGNFGGYAGLRTDYANFFLDAIFSDFRVLLAPITPKVMGGGTVQVVGVISFCALVAGLVLFGRRWWRLLVFVACWLVLTLIPVLNITVLSTDLQQNRLLYLPAVSYCAIAAAFLYSTIRLASRSGPRWRTLSIIGVGAMLLLCTAITWLQLRPWHTASVQSVELNQELLRLVPERPSPRRTLMTWNVTGLPHDYEGAYLPHLALGAARYYIAGKDSSFIKELAPGARVDLTSQATDTFAINMSYHPEDVRYHVDGISGITAASSAPTARAGSDWLSVWDFTACSPDTLDAWHVENAQAACEPGKTKGLTLQQPTADSQLLGPAIYLQPIENGARFMRIRVSVNFPSDPAIPPPVLGEWFWRGGEAGWSADQSVSMHVRQAGVPEVYWTFIPVSQCGQVVTQLRFDSANAAIPAAIQWIAVDLVH